MLAVASFALLRPALRPRPCVMMSVEPDRSPAPQMAAGLQPSADRTGELYRRMETILRAAEKGPRAAMARAINSRWFDLEPAALVENVLVATGLDFEAATSLVELAEEEAVAEANADLRKLSVPPMRREELIGARLYTGPMFQKCVHTLS